MTGDENKQEEREGEGAPGQNAPWVAKRRLPFDEPKPGKRHPGLNAAAAVYAIAALIAWSVGVYMLIQGHPLVSVPVLASAAIGIWFFIRMLFMFRAPKAPEDR